MNRLLSFLPTALVALVFGFLGAWAFALSGLGGEATRAWLLAHPEILPEMAEAYQANEAKDRLADVADEVTRPFPGAVLGNPQGSVTLVEFTDYGCSFCRQSVADVKALVAANPDLRVVMREWPIFEGSEMPARMALAAARQGKYAVFHDALFAHGTPTDATIAIAAEAAGLDMDAARAFAQSEAATFELQNNIALARRLGFDGTPSWVAGDKVFAGAVGRERLAEAVEAARKGA
ncbi:DSBA-like thioredoxin domain protein [Tsuneonella dongtanensis]|uniref:DSBA-like thioredoxin domain protein n=1 Tax=Tsuneonella dongtanensis TaxID=692370 RepID=A0A1B2AAB7_9SPHN|nr:DsbA family protein [Tsuneonella dongtanensis]ANY19086.1 DSBA-like thioredoxin domain protein [Tsuneonella dongtanensis]